MPVLRKRYVLNRRKLYRRRRMRGRGIMDFLGKANNFLKDTKLLSKGAAVIAPRLGGKFGGYLGQAGNLAGSLGYGRRRRIGRGLRLAGM